MGIFDLGRAVFIYNSITNGAREGSRLAIVNQDVTSIRTRATSQAAMADKSLSSVTVGFEDAGADGLSTGGTCSPIQIDCLATVQYETDYEPLTPIIGSILFPSGVTLTAVSTEPIEFVCPNATLGAGACPKQP